MSPIVASSLDGALPASNPKQAAVPPTPLPYPTNVWAPSESGLLSATYDFVEGGMASSGVAAGVMKLGRVPISVPVTVSTLECLLITAVTGGAGCFMALYDTVTGARLGITADQAAAWATLGYKTAALTAPVTLTNDVLAAVVCITGTGLQVGGSATVSTNIINRGGSGFNKRATSLVGLGSVPAQLPALTDTNQVPYVGLF